MPQFSEQEAAVLNHIQNEVPLAERPFQVIAGDTGLAEQEVIDIIARLKAAGVIRNIAAIFNGESLGYQLSLNAFAVPEANIERAAALISSHPGVSHNYLREHRFNIWFTLALEAGVPYDKTVALLARKAGADDHLVLRNERLFKIGLKLPIGEHHEGAGAQPAASSHIRAAARPFSAEERSAIWLLQNDVPLVPEPFTALVAAADTDLSAQRLLEVARALKADAIMRRFAAVLRHMAAGFSNNAMTAWKIDADTNVEQAVQPFMASAAVTHLYLRTIHPGRWEHQLFAMVHGRSAEELQEIIDGLSAASGLTDVLMLRSLREFKKERVIYFSPSFSAWGEQHD